MMDEAERNFKALHEEGFKGMWKIYGGWNFIIDKSFLWAFSLAAIMCLIIACCNLPAHRTFDLISNYIEIGLAIDGGLIGLSLAGLTLIVTFGSDILMRNLVKLNLKEAIENKVAPGFSIYQKAVSKFTFAVLAQIATLIVLFFIKIISDIKLTFDIHCYNQIANIIAIFISLFLLFFSLFLLVQMALNIFTVSQMNHAVYFEDETKNIP